MASTGLLVVSNVKQIGQSLRAIEKYVKNLYIHLNIPVQKIAPLPSWGNMISQLYGDSASYSSSMNVRILIGTLKTQCSPLPLSQEMSVDMLFSDGNFPDICERLRTHLKISNSTIYLDNDSSCYTSDIEQWQNDNTPNKVYNTVVLGGTFDRIHLGHKILLTQAVLRTCKRLVVGVMSDKTTTNKTLSELILPEQQRISEVKDFLTNIDPTLCYDVVAIDDPFGPTKTDPDMDLIIVSEETLRGGHKVNELRVKKSLKPLEIYCINLLELKDAGGPKESKVSSSNVRLDLLGTRLREPTIKPQLLSKPYIIGLTGSIASGKSKMAQRFAMKGAYVIDCDKVAHELYAPGQICYSKVVEHFGNEIVDKDGTINRSKLGKIVFSDPNELTTLNNIVWPNLLLEVKRRIKTAYEKNSSLKVVVLEAAILLRAGWETECHEVWSMIIPQKEAIKRIMQRNQLSEAEALKRLASQLEPKEIVNRSNVIFSSQWDENFTQLQADRAWNMLMSEI